MGTRGVVRWTWTALLTSLLAAASWAEPVGSGFTYQGYLELDGGAADGHFDFEFVLLDNPDVDVAAEVATVRTCGVLVERGIFSTEIDFGPVFNGLAYWLETRVAPAGACDSAAEETMEFVALSPPQSVGATPYALFAIAGNEGPQGPQGPQGPPGASPFTLEGDDVSFTGGAVGIGTASPMATLDVRGTVHLGDALYIVPGGLGSDEWQASTVDSESGLRTATLSAVDDQVQVSAYEDAEFDIHVARTFDGGATWMNTRIAAGSDPDLETTADGSVFMSFEVYPSEDLGFARLAADGMTWEVSTLREAGRVGRNSSIAAPNGQNLVISHYDIVGQMLRLERSADGGATWGSVSLSEGSLRYGFISSLAAVNGTHFLIAYRDDHGEKIRFAQSFNGGQSWLAPMDVVTGTLARSITLVAFDSSRLAVAWVDSDTSELRLAQSKDGGVGWTYTTVVSGVSEATMAARDASRLFIAFRTDGGSQLEIAESFDGGVSWSFGTISYGVGVGTSLEAVGINTLLAASVVGDSALVLRRVNPIFVGVGTQEPTAKFQVGDPGSGTEARANAWSTFSDRRLKKNLQPIHDPLGLVDALSGYFFEWREGDGERQLGVVAQEVQAVLPEIVSGGAGGLAVDYSKLAPLLLEAVKAQQARLDALESCLGNGRRSEPND